MPWRRDDLHTLTTLGTTAVRFIDSELGRWDVHGVKASWRSIRMRSGRLAAEAFWGARWVEGWCVDVCERNGASGEGVGMVA